MSARRLLVTGGSGYLGGEVVRRAAVAGWVAIGTCHRAPGPVRLDVRDRAAVDALVAETRPECIVHTAYVQDGPDAWATNVEGSANVAAAAASAGARLVHLSTDLVFDGRAGRPYREDDPANPVLGYGRSKAAAERAVAATDPAATLVRTSLIYGGEEPSGHERRILDVADGRADLAFFTDELRCPIAVADLAAAVLELAALDIAGPLHVAGADALTRLEFARLICAHHGRDPDALRGEPGGPDRAKHVVLDCARARALLRVRLRGAREVLSR